MNIQWLKTFFEETPGVASMARLNVFNTFLVCVLGVFLVTAWLSITSVDHKWVEIPTGVSYFFGSTFGLATVGKVAQAVFGEKTSTVISPPTS